MSELRDGPTTGSCATAAAMAALQLAADNYLPSLVLVPLPPFADKRPAGVLPVSVAWGERPAPASDGGPGFGRPAAMAAVVKAPSDDPDVTAGATIRVSLFVGGDPALVRANAGRDGDVLLRGGRGVGVVERPGLAIPPGEAAINPVPREQIFFAIRSLNASLAKLPPPYVFVVSVDDGEKLAGETLNERLGVVGGVSILGTGGVVKPFSNKAYMETIRTGVRLAPRDCPLCFSTGRRSERLLTSLYPDLPLAAFVRVADFAAFALREASAAGARRVRWGCFFGKLLKLAQGLPNTHAREGDLDWAWLADLYRPRNDAGASAIADAGSARQALEIILALPDGATLIKETLVRAKKAAAAWFDAELTIHLFHENGEEIARL